MGAPVLPGHASAAHVCATRTWTATGGWNKDINVAYRREPCVSPAMPALAAHLQVPAVRPQLCSTLLPPAGEQLALSPCALLPSLLCSPLPGVQAHPPTAHLQVPVVQHPARDQLVLACMALAAEQRPGVPAHAAARRPASCAA